MDDKPELAETYAEALDERGYAVMVSGSGQKALELLEQDSVDALVTDLRMPDLDGMALLKASKRLDPDRPVLLMTAYGAIDSAVEAVRAGAYHYLTKPFRFEELELLLQRALEERRLRGEAANLKRALKQRFGRAKMLGESAAMRRIGAMLDRLAESSVPVLLNGETGTGKGLLARTIHAESPRGGHAFVTVNCAALPDGLLESELFGHVRGAFTGANTSRPGLFVEADRGTLFLDEIGELGAPLQGKLLDVLERGVVRAVGSTQERSVDVRIIAATNRDLAALVREGAFRADLLYRLDVIALTLPPLRERADDIPLLVEHFLAEMKERHPGSGVQRIDERALRLLADQPWPGNVRELAHAVERLVLLAPGPTVGVDDLAVALRPAPAGADLAFPDEIRPIREIQKRYAEWALAKLGGNQLRTAERLGIDRKTLAKWLAG